MFLKSIKYLPIITLVFFMVLQNSHASKLYNISFSSIDGEKINFSEFKNKVILIVNTASFCGFTKQYYGLQELWDKYNSQDFVLIGFPSNDFGQEAKSNNEVKEICEIDFRINFLLAEISSVKGRDSNLVFKFLKDSLGPKSTPKWNFYKYLINKKGKPVNWYASLTSPKNKNLIKEIELNLKN